MKRSEIFFYGWVIVGATVIWMAYQSTMFTYGMTAFITPIAVTSGWSYSQISLASSVRGLEIGALDPLAGILVDRYSLRWLLIGGAIIIAIGAFIISQAPPSLGLFFLGFLVAGLGTSFCQNIVPQTVLARWFRKNIGKAAGLLSLGFALGGLFVPLLTKGIDSIGWQRMLLYLAFGTVVLGIPIAFIFRDRPQKYGLHPDGLPPDEHGSARSAAGGLSVRQALRTRAFWLIGIAAMFQFTAVNAVTIYTIPYLSEDIGIARSTAAFAVMIISMIGFVVRLLYGITADIFPKKYVYAFSLAATTLGVVILGMVGDTYTMMVVFCVVYGLGVSGSTSMRTPTVREYFGAKHFGSVYGALSVFTVIGGTTGSPIAGWVFDTTGSFFPIWYIYAGLTAIGTVALLMLPKPQPYPDVTGSGETDVKRLLKIQS